MAQEHDHNRNEFDEEYHFDDESDLKMDLDSMEDFDEEEPKHKTRGADYSADGDLQESAKDKYMHFIKSYWWVAIVGVALIYPAVHQLQNMFGAPAEPEKMKKDVSFSEVKKSAEPKAEEKVAKTEDKSTSPEQKFEEQKSEENKSAENKLAEQKPAENKPIPQLSENTATTAAIPPAATASVPTAAAPIPAATTAAATPAPAAAPAAPAAAAPAPAPAKNPVNDPFAGLSLPATNTPAAQPAAAAEAAPPAEDRVKGLEDRITKMEKTVDSLNGLPAATDAAAKVAEQNAQQLKTLSTNIQDMQSSMNDIAKIAQAPRAQVVAPNGAVMPTATPGNDYIVQATIPGRAWLMDKQGTLMTVREGDVIPGIGQVVKIDSVKGTVAMSNSVVYREEQ